jgi:hypothetical protein
VASDHDPTHVVEALACNRHAQHLATTCILANFGAVHHETSSLSACRLSDAALSVNSVCEVLVVQFRSH